MAWLEDQFPEKEILVGALALHRYQEPLDGFRHRAKVRDGWVRFDTPEGWTDSSDDLDSRRGFRVERADDGRVALSYRGRRPPDRTYLLILDGLAPRFVPLDQLVEEGS